ncbi:glycosyltransferase 87 family protein [Candidatus Alkanophaga liquidiphilum]
MRLRLSVGKGGLRFLMPILACSFALRLFLFPLDGYYIDMNDFKIWFHVAAEHPFSFYERTWSDYPPFNVYVFWLFGSIAAALNLWGLPHFVVKLPANIFDVATAALIFAMLRRSSDDERLAVFATAAYAFNPAIIFEAAVWGQMDAIYTFFAVLSFFLVLKGRLELSAASFAVAVLTKPQSVVALPPLLIYVARRFFSVARRRKFVLRLTLSAFVFVAVCLLLVVPFVPPHGSGRLADRLANVPEFLNEIYTEGYECYPYTSINAYNIWALFLGGFWRPDGQKFLWLSYRTYGVLMFCMLVVIVLFSLWRRLPKDEDEKLAEVEILAFSTFLMFFSFFMTMTRMHERYLFPAFAFLALALWRRASWAIYAGLTVTFFFNLCYVLRVLNAKSFIPDGDPSLLIIPLLNILLLFFSFLTFVWRSEPQLFIKASKIGEQ